MSSSFKLSLPAAILININIMLGAGLFINTLTISKRTGILGPFLYLLIGLLVFPLVLAIAKLLKIYPAGSFYTFGSKGINKGAGFFAIWAYFCSTLASCTLMIHFFSQVIHSLFPKLQVLNIFTIDLMILLIFSILNMLNLRSGSRIQILFLILKSVPILFVVLSGILLFSTDNIILNNAFWDGIVPSIAISIYVFTGFEAACSLSRHIKNPDKNAPKAVLFSFAIIVLTVFLFQFFFYNLVGSELINKTTEYFQIFPTLLNSIFSNSPVLKLKLQALLQIFVACSALGGAYGILSSNIWNLYTIAENKHTYLPNILEKLNKFGIPFICVFIEIFIIILYLMITKGDRISLAQTSSLGSTIAYSISVISLLITTHKIKNFSSTIIIPILGIISCVIFISMCINGFILHGIIPLFTYLALLIFGVIMFFATRKQQSV